jgi:hypothetical protein
MIGDAALALATPSRYALLWSGGPRFWQRTMRFFSDRPGLTRALAAAQLAAGLWLGVRQAA